MYKKFAENTIFMKKLGKESFLNITNEKKTEHTHILEKFLVKEQ